MELEVPGELEAGAFAEILSAWWTHHHLVLDFGVKTGEERTSVTARVRVPATAGLDVADALGEGIQGYELEFGEIRRPRLRGEA